MKLDSPGAPRAEAKRRQPRNEVPFGAASWGPRVNVRCRAFCVRSGRAAGWRNRVPNAE
jgi:hypothetical protein